MRGSRVVIVTVVIASVGLLAACSDDEPSVEFEPVTYDFIGELVAADTSGWRIEQSDTSESAIAATDGGVGSQILVGPATLMLDDGTLIDVPAGTPGGNRCPQLDVFNEPPDVPTVLGGREACLVIGAFVEGTNSAEWFVTTLVTTVDGGGYSVPAAGLGQGVVHIPVGGSSVVQLRVAPGATELGCGTPLRELMTNGLDTGFAAVVDGDGNVVGIQCYASM